MENGLLLDHFQCLAADSGRNALQDGFSEAVGEDSFHPLALCAISVRKLPGMPPDACQKLTFPQAQ
jgi:hypothetical protein